MQDSYKVAAHAAETEFTEKKSRFITYAECVAAPEEAEAFIAKVRAAHPDARHVCSAWRTHTPFCEKCSDDGEPQGTAGRPMLGVLQKAELFDICICVVRYFGGILLGTGGLARAYAKGCADGVEAAGCLMMRRAVRMDVSVSYRYAGILDACAGKYGGRTEDKRFEDTVRAVLIVPEEFGADAVREIRDATAGTAQIGESERILCKL